MAQLTFYGATGTVTGSRFLLDLDDKRLLIDCGMFQGQKQNRLRNWEPFPVKPSSINQVLLTHAHIDHAGFLPRIVRDGFRGRVSSTTATADLCRVMLLDSAYLQEEDARWANKKGFSKHDPAEPLYTTKNAEAALKLFKPNHYGEDFYINDYRVKFKDAGHILGSAIIDIKATKRHKSRKIIFTGDIGRPGKQVLRDPTQIYNVDYLVIESTYGDRLHTKSSPAVDLARVIKEGMERGGVLVIPSFAVGRTQHLLFLIRELEEKELIPKLDIYVDSPMAIETTEIFDRHIDNLNMASRVLTLEGSRIFQPERLHICKSVEDSKQINNINKNAVIISASGMVTGGRILHHMAHRLPEPKNTILFIGFQAYGTRGRSMVDGETEIKIHGEQVPVNAHIESILGFSGHADYNEMLAWLMAFNKAPEKTFIVHGEPSSSEAMAEHIRHHLKWDVEIPKLGDAYELNI